MNMIRRIIRNDPEITAQEYSDYFSEVFEDRKNASLTIALLTALSAKPVNGNDIIGLVNFIEKDAAKRELSVSHKAINIVGTGGGIASFNISTTAAFVAAAAGATILKSGSYAYNSQCGSLDLLASLGIDLNLTVTGMEAMLEELNIGFVSPALYPPVLRRIAVSIVPLNIRDIGGIINTIGPLLCPFRVSGQVCGVRSYELVEIFAKALQARQLNNSIAVWSEIGLDEFAAIGNSHFAKASAPDEIVRFNPVEYGMQHTDLSQLGGLSPESNAEIMEGVLKGGRPLLARDTVVVNAAFAIYLAGNSASIEEALQLAHDSLATGAAFRLLQDAKSFSHDFAEEV